MIYDNLHTQTYKRRSPIERVSMLQARPLSARRHEVPTMPRARSQSLIETGERRSSSHQSTELEDSEEIMYVFAEIEMRRLSRV